MTRPLIRILVVDPHAIMRRGVISLLVSHEIYEVVGEASDKEMALRLATEADPRVAIVGHSPPELNGVELTSLILAASPAVQVLVHANAYSETLVASALEAGAIGIVLKIDPEENLVAGINAARLGRSFFSESISRPLLIRLEQRRARSAQACLTNRENEILQLLVAGFTNKQICSVLGGSVKTVETHRANIKDKLGLGSSPADLVRFALRNEIVQV